MTKLEKLEIQLHKLNRVKGKNIELKIFYDPEYKDFMFITSIGELTLYQFEELNNVSHIGYYYNVFGDGWDLDLFQGSIDDIEDLKYELDFIKKVNEFMELDFSMRDI